MATWELAYKQAHTKARVKVQAHEGSTKFGAANSAARQEAHLPLDNQLEGDSSNVKTLEGYFDNLADAVTNEKDVLKQLVLNNITLATSNESLVALEKSNKMRSRTWSGNFTAIRSYANPAQGTPQPYALTVKKRGTTSPKIDMSWLKTKTSAPQVGEALCDGGGQ